MLPPNPPSNEQNAQIPRPNCIPLKPKLLLCLALVLSGGRCLVQADSPPTAQLEAEQRELSALLARASLAGSQSNSPAISRRDGDFSPYLTELEDERLTSLLRDPDVSNIVTREQALAAINRRLIDGSLPGFSYDALMDLVNRRWPHDPAIIAFYREALTSRGDAAISDLWSPQPGVWDDSLLEPVVSLVEKTTSWMVLDDALSVLDQHYIVWTNDPSIPPRLSKAVLTLFPSLTNASVNPRLKGLMWCNAVRMLGESHDPAMVSLLRPYLKDKALANDPGGIGAGITTMRVCDDAAEALYSLLNLKLEVPRSDMFLFGHENFTNGTNVDIWICHSATGNAVWPGFDPVWNEWDKRIAELQKHLNALTKKGVFTTSP